MQSGTFENKVKNWFFIELNIGKPTVTHNFLCLTLFFLNQKNNTRIGWNFRMKQYYWQKVDSTASFSNF